MMDQETIAVLVEALEDAQEKLRLYQAQHSGEYVGGLEFGFLMEKISEAIAMAQVDSFYQTHRLHKGEEE